MKNRKAQDMIKNQRASMTEAYEPPVCEMLPFDGQALCQTSFTGGDIQPGNGENWGNF